MSGGENTDNATEEIIGREISYRETGVRVAGAWLAIGSLLIVVSLALHPPPSPVPSEFMAIIADSPTRWMAVHWGAALALIMIVIAGLIMLTARSRLTQAWWTMTAWTVLVVGALGVTVTAIAEATVITAAAVAGDAAAFEAWQLFADGTALGFGFIAAAVALIAFNETRSAQSVTPAWAAWIGAIAAIVAVGGFVLGLVLGIAIGGAIWLASTIVMSLWTLWFGVALARSDSSAVELEEVSVTRPKIT